MTIERPEANPQPGRVRVLHEGAQARVVFLSPFASFTLAPRLNDRPRCIPPASIIRRARQRRRWQRLPEQLLRLRRVGFLPGRWAKQDGAEQTQSRPNRDCLGERRCLRVGGSGEHEHWLHVQRSGLGAVSGSLRRGQPSLYSPSSVHNARRCSGSFDFKSRLRMISGHVRRLSSRSARSTNGRMRSKNESRNEGSRPSNGSPCDTIDRPGRSSSAGRQTRSCSIASGTSCAERPVDAVGELVRCMDTRCGHPAGPACQALWRSVATGSRRRRRASRRSRQRRGSRAASIDLSRIASLGSEFRTRSAAPLLDHSMGYASLMTPNVDEPQRRRWTLVVGRVQRVERFEARVNVCVSQR